MKILLTGGTGFLGKRVLDLLVAEPLVSHIDVLTRRELTHPSRKVALHRVDLADPRSAQGIVIEADKVIHLAGLYDFGRPFADNYQQNVLSTVNLIERIRESGHTPEILAASTYAVGLGSERPLEEEALRILPPVTQPYAHTKAVAEQVIARSGLPASIFRLGVLVGDSQNGSFEKIDGPYHVIRMLEKAAAVPGLNRARTLPVPINPEGHLPVVPVDSAAKIFCRAALSHESRTDVRYYGLFREDTINLERLTAELFLQFFPGVRPIFSKKLTRPWVLGAQARITGVPPEVFAFTSAPIRLRNPKFREAFGDAALPRFEDFKSAFFRGYRDALRGGQP